MNSQINGMRDIIFQQTFCVPGNEDILKTFLENILNIKINNFILLTPVVPLNKTKERTKIVDLLVRADDTIINIELNRFYYKKLNLRNYLYLSALSLSYAKRGEDLNDMPKFIQLNLNTNIPKYKKEHLNYYEIYDKEYLEKFIDEIKFISYNVDKIFELYYNKGNRKVREEAPRYAKYIIMLKLPYEELKEYCKGDEMMEKYANKINDLMAEELENVFLTPEENEKLIQKTIRSEYESIGFEKGEKQGKTIGMKEGKTIGIEEGKTIGIKEGKTIGLLEATSNMAKNLFKKGMPFNDILEVTGLSKEELKKLQMNL